MANPTLPIQPPYCSSQDYSRLCSIDLEVIDRPTTPLIHQMSRFWLINRGFGVLKLQDREYPLRPGTLVSILPWQISDVIQVDEPLQYYLLAYCFDAVSGAAKAMCAGGGEAFSLTQDMAGRPVVCCSGGELKTVRRIFEQLKSEMGLESSGRFPAPRKLHTLYVTGKLIELLIQFQRIGDCGGRAEAQDAGGIKKSDILHYMYNNLSKKLTLLGLSQRFCMSESSISAYITQTTGLSFFDLLNEMRVGKTINFLLYTSLTMEELAEILGFVDSAHICKVFSARVGMKANDFRKTYQRASQLCGVKPGRDAYEIVAYIYRNYDKELTPQATAGRFGVSVRELNTILLYQVEKNFPDFLNFVRVNRASELLKSTDKSITEIAVEVGYNTAKTLTRSFLKYRTMTPGAFRKRIEIQDKTL